MAAGDTQITITGNLVEDPALRFTQQGQPVASFRVASVPRYFDKQANEWRDSEGLFMTVNVWRQQAENVSESLQRGNRVVVTGRLKQRSYETKEGDKRAVLEVEADDVAASLKFATAKVSKAARSRSPRAGTAGGQAAGADPWAADSPEIYSDEPPFLSLRPSARGASFRLVVSERRALSPGFRSVFASNPLEEVRVWAT